MASRVKLHTYCVYDGQTVTVEVEAEEALDAARELRLLVSALNPLVVTPAGSTPSGSDDALRPDVGAS